MIAASFVFILLIAVVSGKSILEMFFGPTVSASENSCVDNSCTCTGDSACSNRIGTADLPLDKYHCIGNNGQCSCGYTKECHCDGNNGMCYYENAEVVICEPMNSAACIK